jgi:hypothetical protein
VCVEADISQAFELKRPPDAIVGRLVLAHQKDPVSVLRRLALCFLELRITGSVYANPARPLLQQVVALTGGLFAEAGMRMDLALHLPSAFVEAGLPLSGMWLHKGVLIRWRRCPLHPLDTGRAGRDATRTERDSRHHAR